MIWIRDRLLKELPRSFDRDARPTPGLSIAYDGTAWVSIDERVLTLQVQGGTGSDATIPLTGKSLTQVVTTINALAGFMAVVTASDDTLPAISLIEIPRREVSESQLFCFTSLLWCVLVPMAWVLSEGVVLQQRAAQQSASIWSAESLWLDYWGELYGNAKRKSGEVDATFATRIIREVLRPKLNGLAIEAIIEEDLGIAARIRNLYLEAWEVGTTRLGRLAGWKYSRTTFEVILSDLVDGVRDVVEKARAAGTYPFYRYQVGQGTADIEDVSISNTITTPDSLDGRYAWIVGRDRCRELPLGGKHLSLFEIATLAPFLEAYLDVSAGEAGDPLVLGTGMLGVNTLGDVTNAGILLSEGDSLFLEIVASSVIFEDQITGTFYRIIFGVTIFATPVVGPGATGWVLNDGWYLGIYNGVLDITETPIPGATPKDGDIDLAVTNGVLDYEPAV